MAEMAEPVPNSDYLLMNPRLPHKDYETMNFSLQNLCNVKNPQDDDQQNPGISCSTPGISCESAETDRSSVYSGSYDNSDSMALMSDSRHGNFKITLDIFSYN